jgi:hypothetical protein
MCEPPEPLPCIIPKRGEMSIVPLKLESLFRGEIIEGSQAMLLEV